MNPRVPGFRAAAVHCGTKSRGLDLALVASEVPASVAGVFTRSAVVGAPVELCRRRVRAGRARALVVNAGVANVAMGERGRRDAEAMTRAAARALGVPEAQVLAASTGVIGQPLPMGKIRAGIARAAAGLSPSGLARAARAIMTTDTLPKLALARTRLGGRPVQVAGIAKGSGMIEPDMATMLAFVLTDAAVAPAFLRGAVSRACAESFNRISVDGETSTSDMLLVLANGAAGHAALRGPGGADASRFERALGEVCGELARAVARDGEGATKLVRVEVAEARTPAEAERACRRIANSLLVKTALFGNDPNWGRILQTVGAARVALRLERTEVSLGGVTVFRRGASAGPGARRRAARAMARPEVAIRVRLGAGRAARRVWTCDLSYDYVRINADYTT